MVIHSIIWKQLLACRLNMTSDQLQITIRKPPKPIFSARIISDNIRSWGTGPRMACLNIYRNRRSLKLTKLFGEKAMKKPRQKQFICVWLSLKKHKCQELRIRNIFRWIAVVNFALFYSISIRHFFYFKNHSFITL